MCPLFAALFSCVTTSTTSRVQAGVSTGGQFAAGVHFESEMSLRPAVVDPELDYDGDDDCSECGAGLEDNEGYDGLCGNCAVLSVAPHRRQLREPFRQHLSLLRIDVHERHGGGKPAGAVAAGYARPQVGAAAAAVPAGS